MNFISFLASYWKVAIVQPCFGFLLLKHSKAENIPVRSGRLVLKYVYLHFEKSKKLLARLVLNQRLTSTSLVTDHHQKMKNLFGSTAKNGRLGRYRKSVKKTKKLPHARTHPETARKIRNDRYRLSKLHYQQCAHKRCGCYSISSWIPETLLFWYHEFWRNWLISRIIPELQILICYSLWFHQI